MKKIFISILFAAGIYSLAMGQQSSSAPLNQTWEKIGEKTINLSENHGVFDWNADRIKSVNPDELYSAIRFRAINEPVDLTNVEVQYDNGQKQDISLNTPVKANSESKEINLDNKDKLDKITFNYKKENTAKQGQAKVEIWGLRSGVSEGMGQSSKPDTSNSKAGQSGKSVQTGKSQPDKSNK